MSERAQTMNEVRVGDRFKDMDRRYRGRAADRELLVTGFTGHGGSGVTLVNCRTFIAGRESRRTMIDVARMRAPYRFKLIARPALVGGVE